MNEDLMLIKQLEYLRLQHKALNDRLDQEAFDEFTRRRLQKEKLHLKDQIVKLEHVVYPDIIA